MKPIAPFHVDFISPVIPKPKSITKINKEIITEATTTIMVLLCSSFQVGHDTLCTISVTVSLKYFLIFDTFNQFCTGGRDRTHDQWFWRPLLYQLSYTRIKRGANSPFNLLILLYLRDDFCNLTSSYSSTTFTDSKTKTFVHCYRND